MSTSLLTDARTYNFIGERLCLDFCNTGENRSDGYVGELLGSYRGLVAWAFQAGLITEADANRLAAEAIRRPEDATTTYQYAIILRESLYRLMSAAAAQRVPADADLDVLNDALSRGLSHRRIERVGEQFTWTWKHDSDDLAQMLWPVVQSAAELLTGPELSRVHECENGNCSWLFLDTSRNHSRRWCTMENCGNVVKARRHRQKQ